MPTTKKNDLPIGKVLLSVVAAAAPVGALVADCNETHVHNPRWLTQAPAALFPGTALADPEFADRQLRVAGVPLNQLTSQVAVLYPLILAGYWWESRRLRQQPRVTAGARRSEASDRHRRNRLRRRRQA